MATITRVQLFPLSIDRYKPPLVAASTTVADALPAVALSMSTFEMLTPLALGLRKALELEAGCCHVFPPSVDLSTPHP